MEVRWQHGLTGSGAADSIDGGCLLAANSSTAAANADSTADDFPIPRRIIPTPSDAEQYLAAARDTSPVYFDHYVLDKRHRPIEVQQAAVDRIQLDPAGRRQHSEDTANNIYYEVATHWGNWAKIFVNNKESSRKPQRLVRAIHGST
jgi:hypothetical protein